MVQLLGQWSNGSGPVYGQIATAIEQLVADGVLRPEDQLPPERALAAALVVSRGTIVRAFDHLAQLGVVERVQGKGTTISGKPLAANQAPADFVGERLWMTDGGAIDLLKAIPAMLPEVRDLVTSIDLSPHAEDLDRAEPLGWWRLREQIAALHTRQGMPSTPHQILVTTGAQQALQLVITTMTRPGDVVLGEDDTWPGLIDAVRQVGARYEPVKLDDQGIIIDDLEAKMDRYRPSLLAVNPQHQNPTGGRLPPARVEAIASLAKKHRVPVLDDRVSADLGFDKRHLPAIDEFDTGGYGITVGSVGKVAWSGLRLGWIRADAQIINGLRTPKAVADMATPGLSQLLGLELIGRYEELASTRVEQLRPAAELVRETLETELSEWSFAPVRGGLSVWAQMPENTSATAFVRHASHHGVLLASGNEFCAIDADCPNIRIPFTAPIDELTEGLRRVVQAWQTFDRQAVFEAVI